MRILMLGWEFPPHISGGLGTACFGITKSLGSLGYKITFVIPRASSETGPPNVELISSSSFPIGDKYPQEVQIFWGLNIRLIKSMLKPYLGKSQYEDILHKRHPA